MKTRMKAIEKGVINKDNLMPRFDRSIDAYWWLIQVYQYLKALKICKEMGVDRIGWRSSTMVVFLEENKSESGAFLF
jgi:hypothetical protein